ncbi:SgcJ/EcaC family oxidoreductase [Variovorax sp. ZS18.2.2]|uniref:SgcJ/EcaC family oxidoreductase n=1 Tax=Variovorax sp. ZS18.2.2 TaxID=2971255 RepID=UPI002150E81F|nr:SgcJ/EcaC family oxidoreductase [Variovorax sp. ZS18.2.2]MCR6476238.1 SgcJ/EcaC family oxidoreductase [Variovorax sp. ZS18.2.2]
MNALRTLGLSATTAAILVISSSAFAQAQAPAAGSCVPATRPQIAALFDRWNDSLRSLDADKVVANYAADGVLLATVSNKPRTTPAEIHDYFVKFLKSGPQGTIDQRVIKIGCNVAQDVGTYTFRFKDGQRVHARYTYVYEWVNGQWLIAHHHSSAMPEAVAQK